MDLPPIEELPENTEVSAEAESISGRGPSLWLAWTAILATILFAMLPHLVVPHEGAAESSIVLPEIQAKYLVGAASVLNIGKGTDQSEILSLLDHGPLRQRLIGVVLQGELIGPAAAAKSLDTLRAGIENHSILAKGTDEEAFHLLQSIQQARIDLQDFESSLTDEERQSFRGLLHQRLGWAGDLALRPKETADQAGRSILLDQARRTLYVIFGVFGFAVVAMGFGVILQIVWWIFVGTGRVHSEIGAIRGNHVIYAETFAVWMALYIALSYAISFSEHLRFSLALISQIGSLAALAWPIIRGIRWSDVREDVGLRLGPQSWTLPFVGIGTYLFALPALGIAMVVTLVMMAAASRFPGANETATAPVHPIVEQILRGDWSSRLQLLFVAVFAAVPEEIMFRGVLYRHLREAGKRFGYLGRVSFASLLSSFIFAAIHPQGMLGIPILMTLAVVFAMAREWRGSLVPSMIAHAMVNAGTSSILFLLAD